MDIIGVTNDAHLEAAAETELRHPVKPPKEPPRSWGRTQIIGLAVFVALPVVIWIVLDLVTAR